jgi:hypothetical protein
LEWGRLLLGDLARRIDEEKAHEEQDQLEEEKRWEELRLEEAQRVEEERQQREEHEAEEECQRLEDAAAEEALRLLMEGGDVNFLEDKQPTPLTQDIDITMVDRVREEVGEEGLVDVRVVESKVGRPRP